uniref:hepatocyte nuclear factor 1-alpha-like n=1 Tax=Oncorhynchus gorbuscha TaxID=8017 RepID=UPI001EAED44C|nr:hepatocyte nuclear factor 1-alpha-like [Oncorhynchus gorbuscha]
MGDGFTTLQPISFQQQLTQQFQNHMGHSPFMCTASPMSPYPPSSLLSQAMVVTDSSSLGTLTSLSTVRQILTTDPEEETEPIQDDSLHLQSPSPVPVSSGNLRVLSSLKLIHLTSSHLRRQTSTPTFLNIWSLLHSGNRM